MTRKKWLYILIILALLTPVLVIYFSFQGNPVAKVNSKFTAQRYLAKTYPEDEFYVGDPFYNFKVGGYEVAVERIGDKSAEDYYFTVVGIFGTKVHYDPIYYENLDEALIRELEKSANEEILEKLQAEIKEIQEVHANLEVLKGRYPEGATWSRDLELEKPFYLWVAIDGQDLKKEDVFKIAKDMQRILNEEGYNYDRVSINSQVFHEGSRILNYSIGFTKDKKIKQRHVSIDNKHLDIH